MTVRAEDFEIIVGNKARDFLSSGVNPEWGGEGRIPAMVEKGIWILRGDGLYHNPDSEELKLTISLEDVEALLSIRDYWKGRTNTATGLATIADSLTAIKYMVFDKKLCTAKELYDAVMANWEGYEPLRQRILNEVPHYGNNDPYADEQMKWMRDTYYEIFRECYSTKTRHFKAGLYSASDHVFQGYHTWATPDGRKTGKPLADATSPAQGRDCNGPTAVCTSACCYDHSKFVDGLARNILPFPRRI